MSNAISELSQLNFDGKPWITQLRNKLCESGMLIEEDIQQAYDNINLETVLEPVELTIPEVVTSTSNRTIYSLYENKNVAGLYNDKIITFSPNFSLIYGKNGSGKTSYYKILKDAFHSNQGVIGNIYNPSVIPSSAKIAFTDKKKHRQNQIKGNVKDFPGIDAITVEWMAGTQTKSNIKFCDDPILRSSMSKKDSGWSIDRYKLGYYDQLRAAVDRVEEKCSTEIAALEKAYSEKLEVLIKGLKGSHEGSIKSDLTLQKDKTQGLIKLLTDLSVLVLEPTHETQKIDLQNDVNVSVEDLTTKIDLYKTGNASIGILKEYLVSKKNLYDELAGIIEQIKTINTLKESLDFSKFKQYQLLFDPLVNQDKYIELLKKITETALTFGFENYPTNIDKCFYCNQSLPDENKSLIASIHSIIDNEVSKEINQLEKQLDNYSTRVDKLIGSIPATFGFS